MIVPFLQLFCEVVNASMSMRSWVTDVNLVGKSRCK